MAVLPRVLVLSAATVLSAGLAASPATATAAEPSFAVHVQQHAVEGMLDGGCNPGVHQGITGWPPDEDCHH